MKKIRQAEYESAWPLIAKAERAMREAVAGVIEAHKESGEPIAVWRRGRVVKLFPEQLAVREPRARYGK